jgi:MoxR-like ATPase
MGLLADGHVLLDDLPGVAKTLMARSLSIVTGLSFSRVQFTPDLLPADITGAMVLDPASRALEFRAGPLFANLVLADEVNRAPAKTQAALLEAMQERQVTADGVAHVLPRPFVVVATQNPIELEGTYPLPEAQLDRFLFNVKLDHLGTEEELAVLARFTTRVDLPQVRACTSVAQLLRFQWLVRQVPVSEAVSRQAVELVRATRPEDPLAREAVRSYVKYGASVRATLFLVLAAKARALLQGRYHVTESDLVALALPVLRHRVLTNYQAEAHGQDSDAVLGSLLQSRALRGAA